MHFAAAKKNAHFAQKCAHKKALQSSFINAKSTETATKCQHKKDLYAAFRLKTTTRNVQKLPKKSNIKKGLVLLHNCADFARKAQQKKGGSAPGEIKRKIQTAPLFLIYPNFYEFAGVIK